MANKKRKRPAIGLTTIKQMQGETALMIATLKSLTHDKDEKPYANKSILFEAIRLMVDCLERGADAAALVHGLKNLGQRQRSKDAALFTLTRAATIALAAIELEGGPVTAELYDRRYKGKVEKPNAKPKSTIILAKR